MKSLMSIFAAMAVAATTAFAAPESDSEVNAHKAALDLHSQLRNNLRSPESREPMLLAAYQPWFGRGNHINVGYSSQDATVIARQIADARNLGIRGFVVNWYGARHEYEDRAYAVVQQQAG